MYYPALSIGIFVISAIFIVMALRWLLKRGWLIPWLKGSAAVLLLLLGISLALAAADLYSYRAVVQESNVAQVSIKKDSNQSFRVTVAIPDQEEQVFELQGDLWQLDARVITWQGPFAALGMDAGYRLDRLSGRYLSLEQERKAEHSVFEVQGSNFGFDVWRWLNSQEWVPWVDANYGAATYMPMKDGAQYVVSLSNKGMQARPLNSVAVDAVESWQ